MAKSGEVGKAGRWVNQTGRATRQSLEVGSATLPQLSGMASGLGTSEPTVSSHRAPRG